MGVNIEEPCVFHNIWGAASSSIPFGLFFGIWQTWTQSLTLMTVQNISRLTSAGIFANKDRWVRWGSHRPSLQGQISEISLQLPCIWWRPVNQSSLHHSLEKCGIGFTSFGLIKQNTFFIDAGPAREVCSNMYPISPIGWTPCVRSQERGWSKKI